MSPDFDAGNSCAAGAKRKNVIEQNKPLTDMHRNVLQIASHHERISQSRLAAYPTTLDMLVRRGYLEDVKVPYSEPYYRITEAGRAVLKEKK